MSSKAKNLLRRLRTKKIEEQAAKSAETRTKTTSSNPELLTNKQKSQVSNYSSSVPKNKKKRDSFIDPLEYFNKERIIIEKMSLEDYSSNKSKGEKDKQKKMGNMAPEKGFKLNFEEMMKIRSKIMKNEVKPENNKITDNPTTEQKNEKRNKEEDLYIKLILAKYKLDRKNNNEHLYTEIVKKINELKGFKDMPDELNKELNNIIEDTKVSKHLILCPDVQLVDNDEGGQFAIEKTHSLDKIINSMNIK